MKPDDTGNNQPTTPVVPPSDPPTPPADTPPSAPADDVTPPVVPPVTEPKPSLSEEQVASLKENITEEVSGEVSKSVIQKIGEALGLTKTEEDKLPTDAEALKKLVDTEVASRFDKVSEDAEKQEKEDATARQERVNKTIDNWHFQYNELARLGKMPLIKSAVDQNDEGVVARKKMIMAIGKIINEVKQTNPDSDHIPSISEALVRFPNVLKDPPGADLPISGNTAVRENTDSFSYEKDIAGKTFEQIVNDGS